MIPPISEVKCSVALEEGKKQTVGDLLSRVVEIIPTRKKTAYYIGACGFCGIASSITLLFTGAMYGISHEGCLDLDQMCSTVKNLMIAAGVLGGVSGLCITVAESYLYRTVPSQQTT